ncbi:MAG: hypothetical protein GY866_12865 [Proteobacteria bacterium]|nr:hypothetical protein [Pseudomonadota bacterium]
MKIRLLDINVLIALSWPNHVNHADAHEWFSSNASEGWATCPITQNGFVRISSNPAIIPDAVLPKDALTVLKRIVAHKNHVFWEVDLGVLKVKGGGVYSVDGIREYEPLGTFFVSVQSRMDIGCSIPHGLQGFAPAPH